MKSREKVQVKTKLFFKLNLYRSVFVDAFFLASFIVMLL